MKRINLAFPFESIQGKQGIKQDLRYAENDNKAFESPAGKTNYARNYKPVMVAARVARTGLNYFAIKTKSATKNTAAWRLVAALMGAMSAIYGWVIKQANIVLQLNVQYAAAIESGYEGTFHKYVGAAIRESLAAKLSTIRLVGPTATVTMGNNPFSSAEEAITIDTNVLVKFWKQLTQNGITFMVGNGTGICIEEDDFGSVASLTRLNVLGISIGQNSYAMIGNQYLLDSNGDYVNSADTITDGAKYTLTDVAPEP